MNTKKLSLWFFTALLCALLLQIVFTKRTNASDLVNKKMPTDNKDQPAEFPSLPNEHEIATLGAGCFWCVEEVLRQQEGVLAVLSGYSGGEEATANYKEVSTGRTKHAEVVQVYFDPKKTDYSKILDAFWYSHDPTQLNRQGNDIGPQYRSVIFYHNEEQRAIAERSIKQLNQSGAYDKKVVTSLDKFEVLYPAENYHQNYYKLNPNNPYLKNVLLPKLKKLGLDY